MARHYDRNGQEISVEEFRNLFKAPYFEIARTQLGATLVSTIWLGVDHARSETGPPLIFETYIASPDPLYADYVRQYATEKMARAGHRRLVNRIRNGLPPFL